MLLRPKFLLFSCVVLIASSCGLKGPLYRPDETNNETVAPTEDATEAAKKKAGESSVQPPAIDPDRPAVPPGH
jgi:predicted small lipoprotein YifL